MHVSIVALGPSASEYMDICKRLGGRHRYCDETWVVNSLGDVLEHDLLFHMDDVRIQAIRAEAMPDSYVAPMLAWLRRHDGPVITSIAHPDFPGLVEFPLAEVLSEHPQAYFNSTVAYAVAYAIYRRVKHISLWGLDFTYPDSHDAERGRACVEFWLGIAAARGIVLTISKKSSLMDAFYGQADRFYGYDCVDLKFERTDSGRVAVAMTERATLPTAAEIEARYDHSVHPNPLMVAESASAVSDPA